jgi:acyl-CoA reductase-like NAD-dependent aldehyde dehydrogenase
VTERLEVHKTYKLFIGGAFPRSESGRSEPVADAAGAHWANASRASRKDVRDAVTAAAKALGGWSGRTPYNRGQVLYRVAELLEGRRAQFAAAVERAEGVRPAEAGRRVAKAIDRMVWYAGWADKLGQVFGTVNPVSGPFANWSTPEPTGVVGLVAPPDSALLGLVSRLAPVITGGNTAVLLAPEAAPLPAIDLAEVLATSDLPGGVVNVLTGRTAELLPPLAAHMEVHGLDLAGVRDPELRRDAEVAAAENVKRVAGPVDLAAGDWLDDARGQDPWWIAAFLETKTTWHPAGL